MNSSHNIHDFLIREIRAEKKELEKRIIESCITGIHKHYYLKDNGTYNFNLLSQELRIGRKKIINILKEK